MLNLKNGTNKNKKYQKEIIKGLILSASSTLSHAQSMKKNYKTLNFDNLIDTCCDLLTELNKIKNDFESNNE
jgi:hypothetical protein